MSHSSREPDVRFHQPTVLVSPTTPFSATFAPDSSALTVVFDDLSLRLQSADSPKRGACTAVVAVPLDRTSGRIVRITADIRGVLSCEGDAACGLEISLGRARRRVGVGPAAHGSRDRRFVLRVTVRLPELPNARRDIVRVGMRLSGRRSEVNAAALCVIDGLDVGFESRAS